MSDIDLNKEATEERRARPEDKITDWYLPDADPMRGFFFPGRVAISDHPQLFKMAAELRDRARHETASGYEEFVVKEGDRSYRGHKITTVEGPVYALRRMPPSVPPIENLGLEQSVQDILLHPGLGKHGGLIIICGETGQGKSTTIASVIMARMERLGSFCLTIEDPPEMPLHGVHGAGICYQTEARIGSFGDALRGAMRCYPAVGHSILYVGETRDGETAAQVLRAAVNGHLVVTTLHANDVSTCAQRFMTLAKSEMGSDEEVRQVTSAAIRLIMHQQLEFIPGHRGMPSTRRLHVSYAISTSFSSPMAQAIRSPSEGSLEDIVQQQRAQIKAHGVAKILGDWSRG